MTLQVMLLTRSSMSRFLVSCGTSELLLESFVSGGPNTSNYTSYYVAYCREIRKSMCVEKCLGGHMHYIN